MKIELSDIQQQIRAMGRADYLRGVGIGNPDTWPFAPKSNAAKLWQEGWREAARWPLILMMEGN